MVRIRWFPHEVLVNAVTVEVGPGTQVSDFPTNRELH